MYLIFNDLCQSKALLAILAILFLPLKMYAQDQEGAALSDEVYEQEKTKYLKEQLELARQYKQDGDYLWAAKLVNYIVAESPDNDLAAESLFELISIGNEVAKQINNRSQTVLLMSQAHSKVKAYEETKGRYSDTWQDQFAPAISNEVNRYREQNIHLFVGKWSNDYFLSRDNLLQRVIEDYPETEWAETAHAGLILDIYGVNMHQAYRFLELYPDSDRKAWVYHVLGRAHSDEFKYGGDCNPEYDGESREDAIKYYLLAKEAYIQGEDDEEIQEASRAAQDLIDGKCPEFLYYLVD